MMLSLLLLQSTYPAAPWIVISMAPEHVVYLINQLYGEIEMSVIAALSIEAEEVADREGVGPQVATG